MSDGDRDIVVAVIGGQSHRFADVVRKYDARVRRVVSRQVRDAGVRDDLVQETFYRAFKKLDQLAEHQALEGWLVAIARRCVADHFRRRRPADRSDSETTGLAAAPDNGALWVWDEVGRLAHADAEVLRLRYLESLSYEELAARLNVPVSTVRGRIYEARRALRKRLEEKGLLP